MAVISAEPQVMHRQAVIAGTCVPVSVILDCLAAGMTALPREELLPLPQSR
jgi:uncharacterized protein (DUF433 family)